MSSERREISLLMVLHGLLAFSLPLALLFLTSCLDAEGDPQPFGDEISVEAISDALIEPYFSLNAEEIYQGEFVFIETSQNVTDGSKFVLRDTGVTVIDRTETSETITLTLATEEYEYDGNGASNHVIFEDDVILTKASASSQSGGGSAGPEDINLQSLASTTPILEDGRVGAFFARQGEVQALSESVSICDAIDDPTVSHHDLRVESGTYEIPSAAEDFSLCAGQSPCNVNATRISFNQVFWEDETQTEGTSVACEFVFSTEVPYLSAQLQFCYTYVITTEDTSTLLTECQEVMDFVEGTP